MTYDEIRSSRCTKCRRNTAIVVSEKRCRYQINNPDKKLICVTKMDGCFVIQQTACDYLVANSREKSAYFIELKGSDVYKAYEQIQQTIFHVKDKLRGFTVNVRVIPTKVAVPDIQNDSKTLLFRKLIKSFDGDLKIKSISMIEKI